jgi:hypothetical protein
MKNRSYTKQALILLVLIALDFFFSKIWPVILFGKSKLDLMEDLIFKKFFFSLFFGLFSNGFLGYLFVTK